MKALDVTRHKTHLTNLLIDIYKNSRLGPRLGFKGGTAAMLFYQLPRFSVDLDFDLIIPMQPDSREMDMFLDEMTKQVSSKYFIKDQSKKYHTLFWLVSYGTGLTNIKIEISTRDNSDNHYIPVSFYGTTVTVMSCADMIAHKMMALIGRKTIANRDIFDMHYFLSSQYAGTINYDIIKKKTGQEPKEFYAHILNFVSHIPSGSVLSGLGEILTNSQKEWAKAKLIEELQGLIQRQIDVL